MRRNKKRHEVLNRLRKDNASFYKPLIRYAMKEISEDDFRNSECIEKYTERLNYLKKRFGNTYIQISQNLGLSHTAIENTFTQIDSEYLEIFAFWFQVSPLYLIGKTDYILKEEKESEEENEKNNNSNVNSDELTNKELKENTEDDKDDEISEDEIYEKLSGKYIITKRKEFISLINKKKINPALSKGRVRKMKGDELNTPFEYDDSSVFDLAKEIVFNLFPTRIGRIFLVDILKICDASDKHFKELKDYLLSHTFINQLFDLKNDSTNKRRKNEWDNYELQNPKYRFTKNDCVRIISEKGKFDREFLVLLARLSELPLHKIETIHNWLELCGWFDNKKMFCAKYRIEKVAEENFLIFFKNDDELTIDIKRKLSK